MKKDSIGFNRVSLVLAVAVLSLFHHASYAGPIAEGSTKFLGNITNGNPASNFGDYWNQITLENGGKWGSVQPSNQNSFSWSQTDAAYNYCKTKGWPYKHHCFVWGQQQPGWVNAGNARAAVENYIKTYGTRYPETAMIDVVNEPLHAPAGYREGLGGNGTTGWDWVITTFELARKYCPNAKLILNDYGIVNDVNATKRFLQIIRLLQERKLIDMIGVQSHCFNLENTQPATITRNLDSLANTGLPITSSEFDLRGDETTQLNRYKTYFPLFWEHRAVVGVTLWGYTNNWEGAIIMSGGREYAALKWLRVYVDSLEKYTSNMPASQPRHRNDPFSFTMNHSGQGVVTFGASAGEPVSLHVFDPTGRTVYSSTHRGAHAGAASVSFSTAAFGKGCYMLRVVNGQSQTVRKIVVR